MSDVKKHGIIQQLPAQDPLDENMAELLINGYTILDSGLSDLMLGDLRNSLDEVYLQQVDEIGGEDLLRSMNDKDIVRAPLAYYNIFLDAIWSNNIQNFCKKVFEHGHILVSQNGLLNRPQTDFYQTFWHRDLNYQHWTCSKPLGITAILCVNDFTAENGATYVIPGSHGLSEFPTDAFVEKHEKQIEAKAGSFIIINSMMFHRAGVNLSGDIRRGLAHVIGQPFWGQSINIPDFFNSKGILPPTDKECQSFLGFRWGSASSVYDWRSKRLP